MSENNYLCCFIIYKEIYKLLYLLYLICIKLAREERGREI